MNPIFEVLKLGWAFRKYVALILALVAAYVAFAMWKADLIDVGVMKERAVWAVKWAARDAADLLALKTELQRQRDEKVETDKRNATIEAKINDKDKEAASLRRDLDVARRLLAAAVSAGGAHHVGGSTAATEGVDKPFPSGAGASGEDAGAGSLVGAIAGAVGECRKNADRLDGLLLELKPQLSTTGARSSAGATLE